MFNIQICYIGRHALEQRISAAPLPNWPIKKLFHAAVAFDRNVLCGNFPLTVQLLISFERIWVYSWPFNTDRVYHLMYSYFSSNPSVFELKNYA